MSLKEFLEKHENAKDEKTIIKKPDEGMEENERKRLHVLTPEQKKELMRRELARSKGHSY